MAKVINKGFTDTPISGVTKLDFPRGLLNFGKDFRVQDHSKGTAELTNLTSPIDRPERVRWAETNVPNIYKGTDIDPSVFAPSTRGFSLLSQITETFSVTDDTDPMFRVDLPISAHLVIKAPASEFISAEDILLVVGRLISTLYDTGSTDPARLKALIRGSLVPTDV